MSPRCAVTGSSLGLESGCGEQQMRAMVMETGRIVHAASPGNSSTIRRRGAPVLDFEQPILVMERHVVRVLIRSTVTRSMPAVHRCL